MSEQEIRYGTYTNSFDVSIAVHFMDANVAIVYNHIYRWLIHNKHAGINQINDRTWTYQSIVEIEKNLPYLTEKQIRNALQKLVEDNFLIKDCFNKNAFDRTSWYALPNEDMLDFKKRNTMRPPGQMDAPSRANPNAPQGKCYNTSRETSREHLENNDTVESSVVVEIPSSFLDSEKGNPSTSQDSVLKSEVPPAVQSTTTRSRRGKAQLRRRNGSSLTSASRER